MKKIFFCFILFCLFNVGNAQVSGYMGKKFLILYTPAISLPHLSNLYNDSIRPSFSFNQNLSIEYIISDKSAIGLNYKFSFNSSKNDREFKNADDFKTFHKFFSHTSGVYYKVYTSKTISPLGFYIKPGLNLQYLILKDFSDNYYIDINNSRTEMYTFRQVDIVASFSVGQNWIFFDNLILGFEVKSGLAFASFIRTVFGSDNSIVNEYTGSRYSNKFNFPTEILQIGLNIGFLAF